MDLTLPLDYAAIERILLHRYPFLFVDRITELEVDKRIVGIKNVSLNERYLSNATNGPPVVPPTILTEAGAESRAVLGLKTVSLNDRSLSNATNGPPVLPPTILTEAVAQVGAILVLAKPENRQRL